MSSTGPASFKVPSNRAPVESLTLNMQALRLPKKAASGDRPARTWADAPEFVPRGAAQPDQPKSWAHVVNPVAMAEMTAAEAETELCPFGVNGECRFGEGGCSYVHGDVCEMCGSAALHPTHQEQRRQHEFICMKQHEHDMEVAFAYAKSKEKTCGICMEVVVDKHPKGEARFGIMPSCNHCFCLGCLRTWRQAKNFESKVIRSCPECRITSDFICPSRFWVDTEAEKAELLSSYKSNQATKDCKYFMNGEAECPFGNKCFYRHVTKDGRGVDVGPPPRRPMRQDADGAIEIASVLLMNDFLEARDAAFSAVPVEYLDLLGLLSDDDSEIEVELVARHASDFI